RGGAGGGARRTRPLRRRRLLRPTHGPRRRRRAGDVPRPGTCPVQGARHGRRRQRDVWAPHRPHLARPRHRLRPRRAGRRRCGLHARGAPAGGGDGRATGSGRRAGMTTDHGPRTTDAREAEPYALLAEGYDAVMAHVDYVAWAGYVHGLLLRHHPGARDVLELGCGTGSLALALQPLGGAGGYRYRATDASAAMLRVAERKARAAGVPVAFAQADFRALPTMPPADVVLLLYDGLNYLLDARDVARLFEGVARVLRP